MPSGHIKTAADTCIWQRSTFSLGNSKGKIEEHWYEVTEVVLLESIPLILHAFQMIFAESTGLLIYFTAGLIFYHGARAHSGPRPPHYRGFVTTLRHTTLGRTPLDEWSALRRDLYLTTHNTHNRQTSIPPAGFEPAIPASERPQTARPLGSVRCSV